MTTPERVPNLTPVDRQVNQLQPRQEKTPSQPKSIKGWWNRFFVTLLLAGHLYGCSGMVQARPDPEFLTEAAATATSTYLPPQDTPESSTPLPTVTKTKVPTPTRKATETQAPTPTKTETPEKYPIDIEKLSNPPQSYEDFVNNLNKFVQAPSPDGSDENFQEFVTWYNEVLFKKLLGGDLEKLPVNYDVEAIGIGATTLMAYNRNPQERHSLPYFFYFKDRHGVPYPCYIVTLATPEYQQTFTVIGRESSRQLAPLLGSPEMVTEIYQGVNSFSTLALIFNKTTTNSDTENSLVEKGFGSFPSTIGEITIGFGGLSFSNK